MRRAAIVFAAAHRYSCPPIDLLSSRAASPEGATPIMEAAPKPGMLRPLRSAQLYGYLIERDGLLFHPGGNRPLCGFYTARLMLNARWLKKVGSRYELTPEALQQLR